jgi:hypothetical protein
MEATILDYDKRSRIMKRVVSPENTVKKRYESMFGKKDTYTDNEIFVFNSMRNVLRILDHDEN